MARTDSKWNQRGSYIETIFEGGINVLINGLNKYLNFNAISGSAGYGFRDNAGVMEFKDNAGAWTPFAGGGGAVYVREYANLAAFPATGTAAVIYIDVATRKIYHWTGTVYAELSPSAGGGVALTEIEVDMGARTKSKRFTITDAAITVANKILVFYSPSVATSRKGNDWEVDTATLTGLAGTGNFLLSVVSPSFLRGNRKLYYQVI